MGLQIPIPITVYQIVGGAFFGRNADHVKLAVNTELINPGLLRLTYYHFTRGLSVFSG